MKNFIMKNNLYIITSVGLIIGIFTALNWSIMPVLQRMAGLFICGLVLHLWEEQKFPGGFADAMVGKLPFTTENIQFGEIITIIYIIFIAFIPFFFPAITFIAVAPALLGVLEAGAHFVGIKMFDSKKFYSPGLITSVFVLLPISIVTLMYVVIQNLMQPIFWLFSLLYMGVGLLSAQFYVVRSSGMKYSEFIKTVRKSLFSKTSEESGLENN